jgi:hypothetical protein
VKTVIDYIYYRFTKFYLKSDGRTGVRSLMAVSMVYSMCLFDVFMIIIHILNVREKVVDTVGAKNIGTLAFVLFLVFNLISYFQYNGKFNSFKVKWKDESPSDYRKNGWLAVIAVLMPIVVAFLLK